jgi:hypothetical protein
MTEGRDMVHYVLYLPDRSILLKGYYGRIPCKIVGCPCIDHVDNTNVHFMGYDEK